jgi:anti-sigma B factor antagonist
LLVDTVDAVAVEDESLRVETTPNGLAVAGEIDAHTVAPLREALRSEKGSGELRIEMSAVNFIDSSGLRVLLEAHRDLEQTGHRLVLVAPSRPVVRLIEVAGLAAHLHVEPPIVPPAE